MRIYRLLSDPVGFLYALLLTLPGIVIGLSLHEFAHAYVAYKLGDPTPKNQGRVTISPFAHFDPIGFVLLVLFGFGYGKPVMVNPNNFKNRRKGEVMVSLAGVTANFLVAVVCAFLYFLLIKFDVLAYDSTIKMILYFVIMINVNLMVFNLLPIPTFDGYNAIRSLLLGKVDMGKLWKVESFFHRYGYVIVLALLALPITGDIIGQLSQWVLELIELLTSWVL